MANDLDMLRVIKEFLRFLLVVAAILMGLFAVWFGLYSVARSEHPKPQPTKTVSKILQKTPLRIPHAVLVNSNSESVLLQTRYDSLSKKWRLVLYGPEPPELKAALLQHPGRFIFLEVLSDDPQALTALKTLLERDALWTRMVFLSNSDKLLKDLREIAPRFSYGTGEVFLTRFLTLSALSLQGLMELPGDIIYVPNRRKLHDDEFLKLVEFASAQSTLVVFGTLNSEAPESPNSAIIIGPEHE